MQNLFTFLLPYLSSPNTWYAAAFGACIGSFLNVCIVRIPQGTFWKSQRSHCPHCNEPIPFWHNAPIFSWLILRGKAACCGGRISIQYPLVEVFTALVFVICYWQFPFVQSIQPEVVLVSDDLIRFFHATVFSSLLIICSVIDFHHQIIPDKISLPMVAVTPVIVYLHPELDWLSALIGVVAGAGVLYAVAWIYFLVRKEPGLGMGDVKLLAGIGGWLGYQSLLPTVFIASISGAVIGLMLMMVKRSMTLKTALPFGPFLALGAWLHLMFGQFIQEFLL